MLLFACAGKEQNNPLCCKVVYTDVSSFRQRLEEIVYGKKTVARIEEWVNGLCPTVHSRGQSGLFCQKSHVDRLPGFVNGTITRRDGCSEWKAVNITDDHVMLKCEDIGGLNEADKVCMVTILGYFKPF